MQNEQSPDGLLKQFIVITQNRYKVLSKKYYVALAGVLSAVLLSGLFLASLLEHYLFLSPAAKFFILGGLLLAAGAITFYRYKTTSSLSFPAFYHLFSKQTGIPELADAFDLYYDDHAQKPPLQQAAIQQNLSKLHPQTIRQKLQEFNKKHQIHRQYQVSLIATGIALFLFGGFSSINISAVERLAQPWQEFTPPNPYSFTIEPGSLTLEQGDSFSPTIHFEDDTPQNLTLLFKTDIEEDYRERNPDSFSGNKASFSPVSVTTDGNYYFVMDGHKSEAFNIDVELRPRFEKLSLHVTQPEYTRLDTSTHQYPFSKIQPYQGATIDIRGKTNKAVTALSYTSTARQDTVILDSDQQDLNQFQVQTKVSETDTISFFMEDSAGLTNKNNFRFVIDPRKDQRPVVNLVEPSESMKMKNAEKLELIFEASDDFGLTDAALHYEHQRAFTSSPEKGSKQLSQPSINEEQRYRWNLPDLNPKPRDVITYWIEVYDNDQYNGAKIGRSQELTITFPSMTEYMDELDEQERDVGQSLDEVSESFERMQNEYNDFKNKLQQDSDTEWEQKQQLDEVEREREEVDKQVEELNKKFEAIKKEIEDSQSMSPETMESYDELQKLMKEINDPELQKALEELRNSLGQMDPDEMRQALENYEFNEEQYKQRIDRTLELFKSLKLNSDLEKNAQSLEELAEQEGEISESEQSPDDDLDQQKAIQNDLSELQKKLDNLDKNAPEKAKKNIQELKKQTGSELDDIQQQLQENIDRLNQQESQQKDPQTKEQQQQIQQQLQQTAEQMRNAQQQLNQQRKQVNMAALEYVLYSLLNLSTNQEKVTKETEDLPPRSNAFVEKAQTEKNISSQFSMLSDSLFQISSEIPSFSNEINKKKMQVEDQLSRAVEMLAERDRSNATYAQRQSLGGINELSSMIASLIDQLNNQEGDGSGGNMSMQQFMEQLQQMSGEQQQLNQQIQDMINDIQGDRLSRDEMERLNQMSRQQNEIRKQMQELQRRGGLESGDRVLSELERMSEEMEDAINDLRGGQLDQQLQQRQENILSRMLNAEKAVQERGEEERREATTAEDREQAESPDMTIEELQKKIRKMINDPDYTKFSDDYQRLIEQYFELLKRYE
ncbi:MAG: DUF4175 family protein [Bacteroidota bacterium]